MSRHVSKKARWFLLLFIIPLFASIYFFNTSARNNLTQMAEEINSIRADILAQEDYRSRIVRNLESSENESQQMREQFEFELSTTDELISELKQDYNTAVKKYENYSQRWPANFFVANSELINFEYFLPA